MATTTYPGQAKDDATARGDTTAGDATQRIGNAFDKATRDVERYATEAAAQGREAAQNVQDVAQNMKSAVDRSLRDQPMTTLAVAAGVGFILGALWKS